MNIMNYSTCRANLKEVMDDVTLTDSHTIVTRQNGKHVVILSLSEYESLYETLHLLGSERNAARLRESIKQLRG